VSPDLRSDEGQAIADTSRALLRRARALAIGEAAAWAAAAGVAARSMVAAAVAGGFVAAWRWSGTGHAAVVRAIERADPASRNVFLTADELIAGVLTTSDEMRARVLADAAVVARRVNRGAIAPIAPAARAVAVAILASAVVWTMPLWRDRVAQVASVVRTQLTGNDAAAAAPLHVRATIEPPPYTGLKPTAVDNPEQVQAIEGSMLTLAVDSSADGVTMEHDGAAVTTARGSDRAFVYRVALKKTGFVVVSAAGARRTIPIVVSPDALPSVKLTAPGRDLVYAGGNARIAFTARATDDFGLRSLRLRYTKVSGSGENFAFEDGEIPLEVARDTPRDWSGRAARSIADLNLKEGDMLVYRAVAADARDSDGTGSSDAFFIEISKRGVAAGDAFTLPEEETKYALSQQMLIVKTERLQQRRSALSDADVTEESLNLAVEQRMIRAEFVFMLGGEVENEETEAEQSNELQEGRLQNRGQRDVRAATIAMSQAEKLLTGGNTRDALVAERAAVAALQRAFARDRYILRALATRSQLDLTRRLTGTMTGAADWRRTVPDAPVNRRAALLQDLLRGLSELRVNQAVSFAPAARLLAEEAIRIDPASNALRQVATELQRAADATDPAVRTAAVSAAEAAAATEARAAHADPTLDARTPGGGLAGAFADAVAAARLKASRSVAGDRR
jgi:hypothetical protein